MLTDRGDIAVLSTLPLSPKAHHTVTSPAIEIFICWRISSALRPCPKRNISFVNAASTVESCPLMMPASSNCRPVSYNPIFTLPVLHCVMLTIVFPERVACVNALTNHSCRGAFPLPKVLNITPLSFLSRIIFFTMSGCMPGNSEKITILGSIS